MSFPQTPGKHAARPFVTPRKLLEYRARIDGPLGVAVPKAVILTWQPSLERLVRDRRDCGQLPRMSSAGSLLLLPNGVGFIRLMVGAPVAGIAIDDLAAHGAEAVIGIGTSGAIGDGLRPGDLVVCEKALRDEGTSHHYAPPGKFADPDTDLTERLRARLPDAGYGPTWTTDAPYRETAEEIRAYREEGILTVDMEAAAIFTVAGLNGIKAASAFCVSDVLHGEEWAPHFRSADVREALWTLFEAAEACLAR
jgi:uridine phosphorylase